MFDMAFSETASEVVGFKDTDFRGAAFETTLSPSPVLKAATSFEPDYQGELESACSFACQDYIFDTCIPNDDFAAYASAKKTNQKGLDILDTDTPRDNCILAIQDGLDELRKKYLEHERVLEDIKKRKEEELGYTERCSKFWGVANQPKIWPDLRRPEPLVNRPVFTPQIWLDFRLICWTPYLLYPSVYPRYYC